TTLSSQLFGTTGSVARLALLRPGCCGAESLEQSRPRFWQYVVLFFDELRGRAHRGRRPNRKGEPGESRTQGIRWSTKTTCRYLGWPDQIQNFRGFSAKIRLPQSRLTRLSDSAFALGVYSIGLTPVPITSDISEHVSCQEDQIGENEEDKAAVQWRRGDMNPV